ncbi:hypothetical protein HYU13_03875 [Candidatus Woesearchaeota archaeon]|nr:hypothetical protein [Candidatus Woesearchaeota archaeon]
MDYLYPRAMKKISGPHPLVDRTDDRAVLIWQDPIYRLELSVGSPGEVAEWYLFEKAWPCGFLDSGKLQLVPREQMREEFVRRKWMAGGLSIAAGIATASSAFYFIHGAMSSGKNIGYSLAIPFGIASLFFFYLAQKVVREPLERHYPTPIVTKEIE